MTFETSTHRVRRVHDRWLAECKAVGDQPARTIGAGFAAMHDAQQACECDAYELASGR